MSEGPSSSETPIAESFCRTPAGCLVTAEGVGYGAQFPSSDAAAAIISHTLVIDDDTGVMVRFSDRKTLLS